MWAYVIRRLLYAIPVYLGIILIVMAALRVNDPVNAYLGKNATKEQIELKRKNMKLDRPFIEQYASFLREIATLNFAASESWRYEGRSVGSILGAAVGPSLSLAIPSVIITTAISLVVGLISAYYRMSILDRSLMVLIVLGMSVSVLVFIIMGQYFGAYWLKTQHGIEWFATGGYERVRMPDAEKASWAAWFKWFFSGGLWTMLGNWVHYCMLPVMIGVVVAMGYDTRFYRAVMVEECSRDYITTAVAKGATKPKIMFVHMLKNAMIPIITRVMITLPFVIGGEILLETQFRIPGMGKELIEAIVNKDFPVIQAFTAVFAAVFVLSSILTDVLYALVDPRVRLS
jgi:peptide/nickel transport system permease protein